MFLKKTKPCLVRARYENYEDRFQVQRATYQSIQEETVVRQSLYLPLIVPVLLILCLPLEFWMWTVSLLILGFAISLFCSYRTHEKYVKDESSYRFKDIKFTVDDTFSENMKHDIFDTYQTVRPEPYEWFIVRGTCVEEIDTMLHERQLTIDEKARIERDKVLQEQKKRQDEKNARIVESARSSLFHGD